MDSLLLVFREWECDRVPSLGNEQKTQTPE